MRFKRAYCCLYRLLISLQIATLCVQLWAQAFPSLNQDDRLFIARHILVAPNDDDTGSPRSDFIVPPSSGMFRDHIDSSDLGRLRTQLVQLPASAIAAVFSRLLSHVEQRSCKSGTTVRVVALVDALDEITEVRLRDGVGDAEGFYEDPVQTFYDAVDCIMQGCKVFENTHLTFVVSSLHRPAGASAVIDVSLDRFMSDVDIAAVWDSQNVARASQVEKFRSDIASGLCSLYTKHKDLRVTLLMGRLLVDIITAPQADEKPQLLQARLTRIIDGMKDARMTKVVSTYMCHCLLSAPGSPDDWGKCVRAASDMLAMVCFTGKETIPSCLSGIMFTKEEVDGAVQHVWKQLLQQKASEHAESEFERVVVDVITRECHDEASFNQFWEDFLVDREELLGRSHARKQSLLKYVDARDQKAGGEGAVKRACRVGWDKVHLVSLSMKRLNAFDTADASASIPVLRELLNHACNGRSARCAATVFSRMCSRSCASVSLADCGLVCFVLTLAVQGHVPTGVRMFRVEEACKEVQDVLTVDRLQCLRQVPTATSDAWTEEVRGSMQNIMNFLRVRGLSDRITALVRTWSAVLPERFQVYAWQWILDAAAKVYRSNRSKANLSKLQEYESAVMSSGLRVPVGIWSCMISARSHDAKACRIMFDLMLSKGVQPDVVTYSTLMEGMKSGRERREVLEEMRGAGVEPNVVTYSTLMEGMKSGRERREVLEEMRGDRKSGV